MTIAVLWWLAALVGLLVYAFSPDPTVPPDCSGGTCMGKHGVIFVVGLVYGVPMMMIGLLVDMMVISLARSVVRSAALLGTLVAWATVALVAAFCIVIVL
jgi:hypothetical protein